MKVTIYAAESVVATIEAFNPVVLHNAICGVIDAPLDMTASIQIQSAIKSGMPEKLFMDQYTIQRS